MDTVVMKNIFPLRYEIHYRPLESGCWIIVPVERKGDRQKRACLTSFESP